MLFSYHKLIKLLIIATRYRFPITSLVTTSICGETTLINQNKKHEIQEQASFSPQPQPDHTIPLLPLRPLRRSPIEPLVFPADQITTLPFLPIDMQQTPALPIRIPRSLRNHKQDTATNIQRNLHYSQNPRKQVPLQLPNLRPRPR